MREKFDTVIIGGGQAGLATGYYLAQQGRDFVILEANQRVGESWRRRWDSLQLFTPAKYSSLPGMPFPADNMHMPRKDEMADYLEVYADRFDLPIRLGVRVERLGREGSRYIIEAGEQEFEAAQVVVATGEYAIPRVPTFAEDLDPAICQLHSGRYRNPEQLLPGDTLVVGVGNSGAEIALELSQTRRVWLAGDPPGQLPKPKLFMAGLLFWFLHNATRKDTRFGRFFHRKLGGGNSAPLEGTSEKDFTAAGIERLPRATGARDGQPVFADGSRLEFANIVWATGFTRDFSWIDLPVFDEQGDPIQERGVVAGEPGLYFIGLFYMYSVSSVLIGGLKRDAGYIAGQIAARAQAAQPAGAQQARQAVAALRK